MHENNSIQTSQVKSMETLACIVLFPFFLPVIPSLLPLCFLLWLGGLTLLWSLIMGCYKKSEFCWVWYEGKNYEKKSNKAVNLHCVYIFFHKTHSSRNINIKIIVQRLKLFSFKYYYLIIFNNNVNFLDIQMYTYND